MEKEQTFHKDKMKMRILIEESTIPVDITHTERNANIRKNEDRSFTRNTEHSQNKIAQTIVHVTRDIKINKEIADAEIAPI